MHITYQCSITATRKQAFRLYIPRIFMNTDTKFYRLMHAVCAGHGYCGGMHGDKFVHVTDLIPDSGVVTADQFVEWVFFAEYRNERERNSPRWNHHRETIRRYFVEHMGSDAVDASQLRWDACG